MKERLQKILATANYGSRRACEELIEQGRVRVNGAIAGLGDKADPAVDVIEVDGERLRPNRTEKVYFALNKPKNVLSTSLPHRSDERRTVFSYVPFEGRLHLIGRLDADSDGLVVLTNDGELAQKLTHPSFRHTKTYRVQITGLPTPDSLRKWREGMYIDEDGEMVKTAPCSVEIVEAGTRQTILRIMMVEGRKRQIRRMANTLGHRVLKLTRTHIGLLPLDPLREGEWRRLTPDELTLLSTPDSEYDEIMKMRSEQKRIERERKETQQRRRSERYAQEAPERPRRSTAGRPSRQSDSPRPASRRTSAGGRGYDDDRGYPAGRSSKPRWERDDRPSAGDRDSRPRRRSADDRGYPAERSSKPRWEHDDRPSAGDRGSQPRRRSADDRSPADDRSSRPRRTSSGYAEDRDRGTRSRPPARDRGDEQPRERGSRPARPGGSGSSRPNKPGTKRPGSPASRGGTSRKPAAGTRQPPQGRGGSGPKRSRRRDNDE